MTARDLLSRAATRRRRRRWLDRSLVASGVVGVVLGAGLLARGSLALPGLMVVAACAAAAAAAAVRGTDDLLAAARRADDLLGGAERFLTVATAKDLQAPALPLVEDQATSLVTSGGAERVAEPLLPGRSACLSLLSGIAVVLLALALRYPYEGAARQERGPATTGGAAEQRAEVPPVEDAGSPVAQPKNTSRPDHPEEAGRRVLWPLPSWLAAILTGSGTDSGKPQARNDDEAQGGGLKGPVPERIEAGATGRGGSDTAPGKGPAREPGAGKAGTGRTEGAGGPGDQQGSAQSKAASGRRGSVAMQRARSGNDGHDTGTREEEVPRPEPAARFGPPGSGVTLRDAGFVVVRVPPARAERRGELVPNRRPAVPAVPRAAGGAPGKTRAPEIRIEQYVPAEYREIIGGTRP